MCRVHFVATGFTSETIVERLRYECERCSVSVCCFPRDNWGHARDSRGLAPLHHGNSSPHVDVSRFDTEIIEGCRVLFLCQELCLTNGSAGAWFRSMCREQMAKLKYNDALIFSTIFPYGNVSRMEKDIFHSELLFSVQFQLLIIFSGSL